MNSTVLKYRLGCKNCMTMSAMVSNIQSETPLLNPTVSKLCELINNAKDTTCPNCGKSGFFEILSFEHDELIYDLENGIHDGIILITCQKRGDSIYPTEKGNNPNFTNRDFYNALILMERELEKIRTKNITGKYGEGEKLYVSEEGSLIMNVVFSKNSAPHFKINEFETYGFSYELIKGVINNYQKRNPKPFA